MGPVSKKNIREKDPLRVSKRRFLITCKPYYLGSSVAPLLGEGGRSLFCVQGTLQSSEEPITNGLFQHSYSLQLTEFLQGSMIYHTNKNNGNSHLTLLIMSRVHSNTASNIFGTCSVTFL